MTKGPIFIGGMFKSGTSLLRAMIGQHPNIASGLETYWFDIDLDNAESENTQQRLKWFAEFYDFGHDEVLRIAEESASVYVFLSTILGRYAARSGKPRWAEKTPGNVCHLDRIFSNWPGAKVVHIVRDPKDIYASMRQAKKWDSIPEFTERWCDIMGAVERFRETMDLSLDRYLEFRYETLVREPEKTTRILFDFLDEPWSEEVAAFAGKADDFDKVLAITGKSSKTLERLSQPLQTGRVGIWRGVLAAEEIDSIRDAVSQRGLGDAFRRIENATPAA